VLALHNLQCVFLFSIVGGKLKCRAKSEDVYVTPLESEASGSMHSALFCTPLQPTQKGRFYSAIVMFSTYAQCGISNIKAVVAAAAAEVKCQ